MKNMHKKFILGVIIIKLTIIISLFLLSKPAKCDSMYDEIEQMIDEANYCEIDSDCEVLHLGGIYIEFGCYHFVNKNTDVFEIYKVMDKYNHDCEQMIDDCAISPEPECVNGKCVSQTR